MLLALAFSLNAAFAPRVELPSVFSGDRAFVTPLIAGSARRIVLWLDSDGSGFLRSRVVRELHLQTLNGHGISMSSAFLPQLDERDFPPVTGNHGALPVLEDSEIASDPIFAGLDGQLGWSWLAGRIWTIDYAGHHIYEDRTAPAYRSADMVELSFDRAHRYPRIDTAIDGKTYLAALDTAATVALSESALAAMNDSLPAVRATSFAPARTVNGWHAAHPEWAYIAAGGSSGGVSLIRVPKVRANRLTFRNVWFSTRPADDVFQGDDVDLKLGPSAYARCAVTIDYVHDAAAFDCP